MASFLFSSWGLLIPKPAPLVPLFWPQVGLCWAEGNIRAGRSQLRSVVPQVCPQTGSISITRETDFTNTNSQAHFWPTESETPGAGPALCKSPLWVPVHINIREPLAQVCLKSALGEGEEEAAALLAGFFSQWTPLVCSLESHAEPHLELDHLSLSSHAKRDLTRTQRLWEKTKTKRLSFQQIKYTQSH